MAFSGSKHDVDRTNCTTLKRKDMRTEIEVAQASDNLKDNVGGSTNSHPLTNKDDPRKPRIKDFAFEANALTATLVFTVRHLEESWMWFSYVRKKAYEENKLVKLARRCHPLTLIVLINLGWVDFSACNWMDARHALGHGLRKHVQQPYKLPPDLRHPAETGAIKVQYAMWDVELAELEKMYEKHWEKNTIVENQNQNRFQPQKPTRPLFPPYNWAKDEEDCARNGHFGPAITNTEESDQYEELYRYFCGKAGHIPETSEELKALFGPLIAAPRGRTPRRALKEQATEIWEESLEVAATEILDEPEHVDEMSFLRPVLQARARSSFPTDADAAVNEKGQAVSLRLPPASISTSSQNVRDADVNDTTSLVAPRRLDSSCPSLNASVLQSKEKRCEKRRRGGTEDDDVPAESPSKRHKAASSIVASSSRMTFEQHAGDTKMEKEGLGTRAKVDETRAAPTPAANLQASTPGAAPVAGNRQLCRQRTALLHGKGTRTS